MRRRNIHHKFWALIPVILIMLTGCNAASIFGGDTSPEIRQQTIEAIATRFTPDAPLSTQSTTPTAAPTIHLAPSVTPEPTHLPVPTDTVCQETHGEIEYREIIIPERSHPLAFRVYIPPCYDTAIEVDYPVLYLLHGKNKSDDQWDRLGVDDIADEMITSGEMPPFMMVMPWEANSFEDDKLSLFGETLIDHLIPWVDAEYRTCDQRPCRAVGGIARGAAWAMRLGLTHWEMFGAIGAHSYTPFSGDFYSAPYWFQAIPEGQYPRIYMDMGATDAMITPAGLFEERLTKYLIPHEWIINVGTHNEEYWSAHIAEYLYWYTFHWKGMYAGPENGFVVPAPVIESTNEEVGS